MERPVVLSAGTPPLQHDAMRQSVGLRETVSPLVVSPASVVNPSTVVGGSIMATAKQATEAVKEVLRIDESEAENHLNQGYELVTVLPSGELLIRKKAQA